MLASAGAVAAQDAADNRGKLDSLLRVRARQLSGRSRVIVQFQGEPDVRAITAHRGTLGRALAGQRAHVAEIDNYELEQLAADSRVARIMADRPAFATLERTGAAVGASLAREDFGVTGRGVGIAVIDSGITSWHDDLYLSQGGSRVVHFKDFTGGFTPHILTAPSAHDPYGHGTHVAGVIAGDGYDSNGARAGVAPQSHLVGLKVLDDEGYGYVSDIIAAIDYAIAVRTAYDIRIINLSIGSGVFESYETDPLTLAARRAVDAGIVVVAAAGNLGRNANGETQHGGITAPGNAPWVLTVGASSHQGTVRRSDDVIGAFSSRGPTWIDLAAKPDLVAPGVGIESLSDPLSRLYATHAEYLLAGTHATSYRPYLSLSGTSMAAPVVTGTVALMLEVNPRLTPNAVKAILQFTAQTQANVDVLAQGAGLLNTRGAIRLARFFADPAAGIQPMSDTVAGETIEWAGHIIWGNHRVTGGVPLPGSNAWDRSLTWGSVKTTGGGAVVWGSARTSLDNIVWSTRARGDNIVWSTRNRDNIVWSTRTRDAENIVWSTRTRDNIVWSTRNRDNIVWSTRARGEDNIVWSTRARGEDNIVWSTRARGEDNIVWSTRARGEDNIVWSTRARGEDNIVWSTGARDADNIVWSTGARDADNIVWSTSIAENMVWSASDADQVLWPASNAIEAGDGITSSANGRVQ